MLRVESVDELLEESEWVPRITSRGIEGVDSSVCREVPWDDWRVRSSCEGFAHSDCDPLTMGLSFVVMVDSVVERGGVIPAACSARGTFDKGDNCFVWVAEHRL